VKNTAIDFTRGINRQGHHDDQCFRYGSAGVAIDHAGPTFERGTQLPMVGQLYQTGRNVQWSRWRVLNQALDGPLDACRRGATWRRIELELNDRACTGHGGLRDDCC
jgi:hypothetical protein